MSSLEKWLAAMPPPDEINSRIEQLEAELALLRVLPRVHTTPPEGSSNGVVRTNGHHAVVSNGTGNGHNGIRPLSDERTAIAKAMMRNKRRIGSPNAVTRLLQSQGHDAETKPIQTTMARMASAGQLERIRKGLYRVPDEVAAMVAREVGAAPAEVMFS